MSSGDWDNYFRDIAMHKVRVDQKVLNDLFQLAQTTDPIDFLSGRGIFRECDTFTPTAGIDCHLLLRIYYYMRLVRNLMKGGKWPDRIIFGQEYATDAQPTTDPDLKFAWGLADDRAREQEVEYKRKLQERNKKLAREEERSHRILRGETRKDLFSETLIDKLQKIKALDQSTVEDSPEFKQLVYNLNQLSVGTKNNPIRFLAEKAARSGIVPQAYLVMDHLNPAFFSALSKGTKNSTFFKNYIQPRVRKEIINTALALHGLNLPDLVLDEIISRSMDTSALTPAERAEIYLNIRRKKPYKEIDNEDYHNGS